MSDNILQTLQHIVQDVIAPDVRELKANQSALEKQIAALERHIDVRFEAADQKAEARFDSLLAAISDPERKPNSPTCASSLLSANASQSSNPSATRFFG